MLRLSQQDPLPALGGFILGHRFRIYYPNNSIASAKPRRLDERLASSNITTEHLLRRG